ncbi:TerC family protein [Aestuariivirga litoralis]|uniref:TerC family protein n=1 Tax=Aestuariivirga litoralis TaxID=2650924 RepID=UPI0018C4E2F7|nr:tellurium resistance protein TerC [Aestuariivirga litoralis]MBG1231122.1 tellurium resistance protein TerC [Aestuariivirga litoralis]
MADFFTAQNLVTLVILTALETVLGFDNLLYISIESKRVDPAHQAYVRKLGTFIAIGLRLVLLFVVLQLIAAFQNPWFSFDIGYASGKFNGHSIIVLFGGLFLIRTALKEIHHMLRVDDLDHGPDGGPAHRSVANALFWIGIMNIVFSFDTVLSAVALTDHFVVMALAIVLSGILMVWLADHVARFLEKNRLYEVLGLFVLLLVGAMLTAEGGHIAELHFFGLEVQELSKTTFYFILAALVIVDVLQGQYQKKLDKEKQKARLH